MKNTWRALVAVAVPAACLFVPAVAVAAPPSGDTCSASGGGTSYTLAITLPANASPQGGFAFGAQGAKVTNINIAGDTGTLSTSNLPPNTTGQWLMSSPPRPGETVTATLTTTAPVTGFTVVPANASASSSFMPALSCAVAHGTPVPSNAFTVNTHVTYDSRASAWHLSVTVPGPGTVTGIEALAAASGSGSKQVTPKSAVQARKVVATSAGTFTLSLRLTSRGSASLKKDGSIKIKMTVAFNPKGGASAAKVINLTLKK